MPMNEDLASGEDMIEADESETKTFASTVARQILLVSDSSHSTLDDDASKAALTHLESIKTGNVGVLSQVSFLLVTKAWPLQVRIYASKMLQYLVKLRWDELSSTEQMDISSASFELMSELAAANPCEECVLKSETVTLVAEIFEKEDVEMWQELFLSLASLSSLGPLQAELALEVVKRLSEHHMDHIKELEDNNQLERLLPDILVWLHDLLEKHFGDARNAEGREKIELAKQHSDAVVACLNTINSLTEWAPVPVFAEYKIIDQCSSLLSSSEFCRLACMFFKLICSRERPTTDASGDEFDSTIRHICKMMVSLGSTNLPCIFKESVAIALYLKQMLRFFEHYKFDLHYESLVFWLGLMEYLISDLNAHNYPHKKGAAIDISNSFGHVLGGGKKGLLLLIDDETTSKILDVSFQRLIRNEEEVLLLPWTNLSLEPSSFTYEEFCKYQKRLFVLIRLISSHKPIITSTKLSSRISMLIKNISVSSAPCIHYAAAMKSQSTALDTILRKLYRGTNEFAGDSSQVHSQLHVIFEGLLKEFLNVNWTEPILISAHNDYLNAMIPFLKYFPDAVGSVINKMFALVTSLPPMSKRARLYICSSLIRVAKTADQSFTPHLKGLADKMTRMQREGTLLPGEHSILVEAFFALTSASGAQTQRDSFVLLLEPVRQQWTQPEWQNEYLSTPSGFISLCSNAPLIRSIVDTVAVFEKALKGCTFKKRKLNMSETIHPLACHLSWMLPPLFKLFRVINSLSSPDVYQTLPTKLKEAMKMREAELHSDQGKKSRAKLTKGLFTYSSEGNTNDIRKGLKAIRDSGYRVLNLCVTMGETFYTSIDANEVAVTFTENIWWMEFRHIKQLINSFVACLVKFCPTDMWETLLEPLLSPLLTHCQRALSSSWTSLMREGKADVPDLRGFEGGGVKKTIPKMEKELLIDLSRSTSDLLSKISAPELNTGLPVLKHSDQLVLGEMSLLKDFHSLKSNCLVSLLLSCRNLADSVMQLCLQACTWRDGITTSNLRCFYNTLIHLAITTNNVELREFVAKDLFNALIMSLTIDENVNNTSVLVGLCNEIFVYLSQRHPAPRQVLLSLPCLTPDDLRDYEKALGGTSESKKQKQITISMLSLALGISLELK